MFSVSYKKRLLALKRFLLPLLILLGFFFLFKGSVEQTARYTFAEEKASLEASILRSAIHSYALTGFYPQSFTELQKEYHITYDTERFLVEYIPNGTNLLPSIQVLNKTTGENIP